MHNFFLFIIFTICIKKLLILKFRNRNIEKKKILIPEVIFVLQH